MHKTGNSLLEKDLRAFEEQYTFHVGIEKEIQSSTRPSVEL